MSDEYEGIPLATEPPADDDWAPPGGGVEDGTGQKAEVPLRRARITWADQIKPEPVVWAWEESAEGRLPAGSLSMAAGWAVRPPTECLNGHPLGPRPSRLHVDVGSVDGRLGRPTSSVGPLPQRSPYQQQKSEWPSRHLTCAHEQNLLRRIAIGSPPRG
jgi:hypothetical protein